MSEGALSVHVIGVGTDPTTGAVRAAGSEVSRIRASIEGQSVRPDEVTVLAADEVLERPNGIGGTAFAAAVNAAVAGSAADLQLLVTPGGWLARGSVEIVSAEFATQPELPAWYSDVQLITGQSNPSFVRLPRWSPERLRNSDYVTGVIAVRTNAWREIGGLDPTADTAWRHDFLLRALEAGWEVGHTAHALLQRSTPDPGCDPDQDLDIVRAHVLRSAIRGEVTLVDGAPRLRRQPPPGARVSVIVPTGGARGDVAGESRVYIEDALASFDRSTTGELNVDYVVVADRRDDVTYVDRLREQLGPRLTIVWFDEEFDFSRKINLGVLASDAEYIAVLNDDMEATEPGWLEQMVAHAADPGVGAVGALLFFEDGAVQHAGHIYEAGECAHAYRGTMDEIGIDRELVLDREVSGVTGAALVQRRDVFDAVGGWSSEFPHSYNDVDFCLKVREAGYRIIQANSARLYHYESKSRNPQTRPEEKYRMRQRWFQRMQTEEYTTAVVL